VPANDCLFVLSFMYYGMKCIINAAGAVALAASLLGGCAGRPAQPVMVYQHGDEARSCDALERELELIEEDILELLPQTEKSDKNTKLGVAGIFLLARFRHRSDGSVWGRQVLAAFEMLKGATVSFDGRARTRLAFVRTDLWFYFRLFRAFDSV